MREKIALKVVKAIYMDRDSSQPMTDISLDIADQILSLPVEGFDCTLGELHEQARKMREAIKYACLTFQMEKQCSEGSDFCTHVCLLNDALTFKDKP